MLRNTRSVGGKAFTVSEHSIETAADLAILTETWLQDEDVATINNLRPSGYSFKEIGRKQKRGGGLGIVHNIELSFTSTSSVEYSSFEHHIALCKHLTLLALYRPTSSSIPVFLDEFEALPAKLDSAAGRVVITGDFNLHVDVGSTPGVSRFKDILTAHDLHQYVDCSTHRFGYTLDLVISRAYSATANNVSVFNNELSYYKSLTFSVHHIHQEQHPHRKVQLGRDFRHVNSQALTGGIMYQLSRLDPSPTHPDTILDQNTFAVNTALDEHFPVVLRRPRKMNTPCWYCAGIHATSESFAVTMRTFCEHPA